MRNKMFSGQPLRPASPLPTVVVGWSMIAALCLVAAAIAAPSSPSAADAAEISEGDAPAELVDRIDALLARAWADAGVAPAEQATDSEFLRRAYLDLVGVIPRASEVHEFLADDRPQKRKRLIEQLLSSPRYATHMATTWRNRILPYGEESQREREAMGLQNWLRVRFADNERYDNLVGGLLLATGGADELGPSLYYQSHDLMPEKIAASAAELFLGVKLHCAQCHDHPYADWSQRDFWSFAAFFARVRSGGDRMSRDSFRLVDADVGEVMLPETDDAVGPRFPRGEASPDRPWESRRLRLALWMTSRDNPFFARAAVNWAWQHLFGRPLAETMDDLGDHRPSTHAQLLDALADGFASGGFDLQRLWRTLTATRAYQLSSRHPSPDDAPPKYFARKLPKPLTPEQLYESFILLSPPGTSTAASMADARRLAAAGPTMDPRRSEFVRRMRAPPGDPVEYRFGTLQALMLMNGETTESVTAHDQSRFLGAINAPFFSDDDRIDAMFVATLARLPDAQERQACVEAVADCQDADQRHRALSDILWALVNSTEFTFNR